LSAPGLAARKGAAHLVAGVIDRGESLSDLIAAEKGPFGALEPGERARAQSLATGVLRHLGRIDAVLGGFVRKAPPPHAMNALRLAVAEMRLDAVPDHAAVDGAVRLARDHPKGKHVAGMVNAVARKVAAGGAPLWEGASEAGLPDWLAQTVRAAWGDVALEGVEAAHLREPPLDLTLRAPREADMWAERLGAEVLPTGSLRIPARGRVSGLPGFEEGAWWVQDAAAAVPARMLGDVAGLRALDLCAAPGGKTLQLAAAGAEVTALDISGPRLARLRENLARIGLSARIVAADALGWTPGEPFDVVLLDAPCSATGTIRRHPDLPHIREEADVTPLVALQEALLRRAWAAVRPGGRLVFCTCSLLPAEGEDQVARFLAATPEARIAPPEAAALGLDPAWIDAAGGLRLRPDHWPGRGGMDGFYAARIEKPAIDA
jgi:16S rRNA (cytosine967-C5)-methyltransferase